MDAQDPRYRNQQARRSSGSSRDGAYQDEGERYTERRRYRDDYAADDYDQRYSGQQSYDRRRAQRDVYGSYGGYDSGYDGGYDDGSYGGRGAYDQQPRQYAQDSYQRQRSGQQAYGGQRGTRSYRESRAYRDTYDDRDPYGYQDSRSAYDAYDDYDERDAYGYREDGPYREAPAARRRADDYDGSGRQRGGQASRRQPQGRSRNVYAGREPSLGDRMGELLGDNVWVSRGLALVALLVLIFILVNVVSCIGGALSGGGEAEPEPQLSTTAEQGEGGDAASESSSTAAASQQGVESPWTESGYFSTGDEKLDAYIKQLCDEHSTEGASFDQNAYDTNVYVSRTDYVERENNQSPFGVGWDVEYAKQYFEEGNSGNCYNFAAVTQFILRYFGYDDAEAQPCVVGLESGNWGDHGLVFVTNKVDGKRCLVDDALSANGWMLDIDAYEYDVRNIDQNPTVTGNVDVLDDADEPMHIQPGNLTE